MEDTRTYWYFGQASLSGSASWVQDRTRSEQRGVSFGKDGGVLGGLGEGRDGRYLVGNGRSLFGTG